MLCADREFGAEVYSGATTEKQAWEVFRPAKLMLQRTPEALEYFDVEVNASNMNIQAEGSKFEPIVGDPGDGSSPHCAIVDEYHEHKDDRQLDTLETGMGAREQPLLLMITTAGDNIAGPCYAMQLDAYRILEGTFTDDQTFSMIYGIDEGDDWTTEESLRKANPNFGISVSKEFLLNQLNRAKNVPRKQSTYKTKHLNIWVGSRDAFFNVQSWSCLADPTLTLDQFRGKRAWLGMDLSSRVDIAALEILIDPDDGGPLVHFGKHYLPERTVEEVEHYKGWMIEDRLTVTEGEIIDFDEIKQDILDLIGELEIVELGYDPFQATKLVTELMDEGVPVAEMRPTVLNFSEPMKELDALIRSKQIKHDGDPVFTWMLGNVQAKKDKKDNVYPTKAVDDAKIDGPVGLLMALNLAMQSDEVSILRAIEEPIKAIR